MGMNGANAPLLSVRDVVMRNVQIGAQTGLTVAYAHVTGEHVTIQAAEGQPLTKLAGADVNLH